MKETRLDQEQAIGHGRRILITSTDLRELTFLLNSAKKYLRRVPHLDSLAEGLREAEVVEPDALPADVVTVGSTVRLTEFHPDEERIYILVFPQQASYDQYQISALSPIGAALLGARTGEIVCVNDASGKREFRIDAVARKADSGA